MHGSEIEETIPQFIDEALSNLHTATIAKVTTVGSKTIGCKPVFNRVVNDEEVELPEFVDVPFFTLLGGPSSITMPIEVGDYALLIFSERCIDNWWAGQDYKRPAEYRMHDYSDAIALVGLKPGGIDIPSLITIIGDLTSDSNIDALTYSVNGSAGATGTFTSADGKTITVTSGIVTSIV
jgi:hypothetical protein